MTWWVAWTVKEKRADHYHSPGIRVSRQLCQMCLTVAIGRPQRLLWQRDLAGGATGREPISHLPGDPGDKAFRIFLRLGETSSRGGLLSLCPQRKPMHCYSSVILQGAESGKFRQGQLREHRGGGGTCPELLPAWMTVCGAVSLLTTVASDGLALWEDAPVLCTLFYD